jgi:hypothetical protein
VELGWHDIVFSRCSVFACETTLEGSVLWRWFIPDFVLFSAARQPIPFRAVLCIVQHIGDSLLAFFWLSNHPRLPPVLRGWCKRWKINRRQKECKERKSQTTINLSIYLNLSKPRVQQVNRKESQTHDQSLSFKSLIDCSTHASESQGKYRYCRAHLPFLSRLPISSINANFRKIDAS